ncbi:MAG TPA: NTP transferase domain-containing protein [Verrucomicrobiae bacterium]|nr:NTP transferase domain-containing protein [Verrucomicrobiae bacterium]
MKAVVTAGGRIAGEYARAAGTDIKALARVRGETMLERIVGALRGAGATRIAVVGGARVREACAGRVELVVDEAAGGAENLVRAMNAWPEDGEPLLYATSDMPYVGAEAIADFLARVPRDALAMPLAPYDAFAARFPGAPPCGITLAGERVVNGDVFYVPAGSLRRVEAIARKFFDARKAPWRMAGLVSPRLLVRFLFRRLGVAHLESHAQRVLGVRAIGARGCAPELAFDADTLADYRYACDRV